MAKIKIQRLNEFQNYFRDFQIRVDGKIIGNIAHGKTKEFEVPSGKHKIIAEIDWCSSQEISFESNDNEVKSFSVRGFKNRWMAPMYLGLVAFFILLFIIMIIQKDDKSILLYLLIPVGMLTSILCVTIIYYITIGRKKYLQLEEQ